MPSAQIAGKILPPLLALTRDNVPNIRFNAVKALGVLVKVLEPAVVTGKVVPALNQLIGDSDKDVSFPPTCTCSPVLLATWSAHTRTLAFALLPRRFVFSLVVC